MHKCNQENLIHHEVLGDYDGILYTSCKECWKKINVHTKKEFTHTKTLEEYSPIYQYNKWKLVWYSRHNAKGLNYYDDINLPENLLWWSYWIEWNEKKTFKPIKLLTKEHITSILEIPALKTKYIKALQGLLLVKTLI